MCLYGYADGSWQLTLPEEMVPPGLPVPTRGINRRRDYVNRSDYLTLVAHHSDSWLMGVTFFLSTHLDANQRIHLFNMVNEMRTVHDEFYISLTWFHGKCVNVTASEAEHIKEYKCPGCIREVIGE
nr:PHD finger protein ALFIN-LIKE 3-like [Aegilops tauschii subsp. strangulata]